MYTVQCSPASKGAPKEKLSCEPKHKKKKITESVEIVSFLSVGAVITVWTDLVFFIRVRNIVVYLDLFA